MANRHFRRTSRKHSKNLMKHMDQLRRPTALRIRKFSQISGNFPFDKIKDLPAVIIDAVKPRRSSNPLFFQKAKNLMNETAICTNRSTNIFSPSDDTLRNPSAGQRDLRLRHHFFQNRWYALPRQSFSTTEKSA